MEDNGQSSASDILNAGEGKGKKGSNAAKKGAKAAKKLGKAAKAAKAAGLFATPFGWVILGIIAVIILIFLIIGTVSFLQTMPGMILGKLLDLASSAWDWIASEATGQDVEQSIKEEQLIEIAQQVEEMGYDLYATGFGKPLYEDEEDPSKITGMDDNYASPLFKYAYADVRTYTKKKEPNVIVSVVTGGLNLLTRLALNGTVKGQGMLELHDGLITNTKVNSKEKKLTMTRRSGFLWWNEDSYVYNLDGWAGRYGMPLSFSLALHLSTMKPDLVTDIINEFDTTVHIKQYPTEIRVKPIFKDADGNEYSDNGYDPIKAAIATGITSQDGSNVYKPIKEAIDAGLISQDAWNAINAKYQVQKAYIYQPYIENVENHWYYEKIDFSNAYQTSYEEYNNKYISSDTEILDGASGELWLEEYGLEPRMVQVKQPEVTGPNEKIKQIFSGSYYTYDGSKITADAIETARKNKDDSLKKPVSFEKRDALEAFSILENCKDLDSQYVYRDLKKLLIELEYFTEEDFEKPDTLVLKWILGGYVPPKWPQHENEISHGAILYSNASEGKEETGFDAEKKVTSPGKGVITKISQDSITIKFTDPEKEAVLDMTIKISGFAVNPELHEGDEIEEGADIGTTTDSDITIILKDPKGSIVDYIEDYLSPKKSAFDSEWSFLYWLPYESGGIDGKGNGPECVGVLIEGEEAAVGIAQWTTKGNTNNIEAFCRYAYEMDPVLCAELQQFIGKSPSWILSNMDRIKNAFADVCNTPEDRNAFLNLQVAKFKEEFDNYANAKNASWLIDRPTVVQATIASLRNWTGDGNPDWTRDRDGTTYSTKDDLKIIRDTLYRACFIPTDVGTLEGRWESQYVLAKDILEGVISEEELENWVRNGNISRYGNGKNAGTLLR